MGWHMVSYWVLGFHYGVRITLLSRYTSVWSLWVQRLTVYCRIRQVINYFNMIIHNYILTRVYPERWSILGRFFMWWCRRSKLFFMWTTDCIKFSYWRQFSSGFNRSYFTCRPVDVLTKNLLDSDRPVRPHSLTGRWSPCGPITHRSVDRNQVVIPHQTMRIWGIFLIC